MGLKEWITWKAGRMAGIIDEAFRLTAKEQLDSFLGRFAVEQIIQFPEEDMRGTFLQAFRDGLDEENHVPADLRDKAVQIMGEELDKAVEEARRFKEAAL